MRRDRSTPAPPLVPAACRHSVPSRRHRPCFRAQVIHRRARLWTCATTTTSIRPRSSAACATISTSRPTSAGRWATTPASCSCPASPPRRCSSSSSSCARATSCCTTSPAAARGACCMRWPRPPASRSSGCMCAGRATAPRWRASTMSTAPAARAGGCGSTAPTSTPTARPARVKLLVASVKRPSTAYRCVPSRRGSSPCVPG